MKTLILAGGRGTRLSEATVVKPKPLVEVGDRPILWHIMNIYAAAGHRDFVVALGYKGELIKAYFSQYHLLEGDLEIHLGSGEVKTYSTSRTDWRVALIETGLDTQTGGRILALRDHIGNETFAMTYGDAVADIDITKQLEFHRRHGRLATITAVYPTPRFGALQIDGDAVTGFKEKPQPDTTSSVVNRRRTGRCNGGFFLLEPEVLDYIDGPSTVWEHEPLERLAEAGQLAAYRHDGFWQPMDTLREKEHLHDLWVTGKAAWKIW